MNHHSYHQARLVFAISFFFILITVPDVMALDSESDRERIVAAKSRRFYQGKRVSESFLLSGNYDSDHNSKQYHIDSRYYYRSQKQMHELYLFHDSDYANLGSSSGRRHLVKRSERYDGTLSDKFMIADSSNYAVLYGRANYDDLSSYYYDLRGAAGVGRLLFNDKVEFDTSVGYTDVKAYGSKIFVLPSIRVNLRLSEKITLTQRGYLFIDHESMDNDFRTRLKYRISKKVSLALTHTYEQRRYGDEGEVVNQVRKYLSVGLVFDLN